MVDATTPPSPAPAGPPGLMIACGSAVHQVEGVDAPIIIGRELLAHVRVDDARISGTHLVVDARGAVWTARDAGSFNGTFHNGEPVTSIDISDGLTLRLGHPQEGVALTFHLNRTKHTTAPPTATPAPAAAEEDVTTEDVARGVARAGAAVVVRREELGYSLRELATAAGLPVEVIAELEQGSRWPDDSAHPPIEDVLTWPRGTLVAIRDGGIDPLEDDTSTEALSNTVRAALVVDALQVQLPHMKKRISALPAVTAPTFAETSSQLAAEIQRLSAVAEESARTSKGLLTGVLLSEYRRSHNELIALIATAPAAPLNHRLYAARNHAALTRQELADAAGVPLAAVEAAESAQPVEAGLIVKLEETINALTSMT